MIEKLHEYFNIARDWAIEHWLYGAVGLGAFILGIIVG